MRSVANFVDILPLNTNNPDLELGSAQSVENEFQFLNPSFFQDHLVLKTYKEDKKPEIRYQIRFTVILLRYLLQI